MSNAVKIRSLELENVKRVKVLTLTPNESGLTIIGGDNGEGKTTALDAITYAVGGEKFKPSNLKRDGSFADPRIRVSFSNGLVAERKGKNSSLTVTDPTGKKGGQAILDSFIETFALVIRKFINLSSAEKSRTLLKIIGIGDQLAVLDREEKAAYDERTSIGQIADRKRKYAEEMAYFADAPEDLLTATDIIRSQQEVLAKNAENDNLRRQAATISDQHANAKQRTADAEQRVRELEKQLQSARAESIRIKEEEVELAKKLEVANSNAADLVDGSTEELEKKLSEIEEINQKVRANLDKKKAAEDAADLSVQYQALTEKIEAVRDRRRALLDGARMPLENMSVEDGELTLNGKKWDCMSGSEQLFAATAIVHKLNPHCGFVLLDGLEAMDMPTLIEFGTWLEDQGLQAIATRVSKGEECSIIIEDGVAVGTSNMKQEDNEF